MLALVAAAELMVADFNSGIKPNNLGGDFGAWITDPADKKRRALKKACVIKWKTAAV